MEYSNAGWTPEESFLLAKMEVEVEFLRLRVQNINQELHTWDQRLNRDKCSLRSYDSIKSHRREMAYREMVPRLGAAAEPHDVLVARPIRASPAPEERVTRSRHTESLETQRGVAQHVQVQHSCPIHAMERLRLSMMEEVRSLTSMQAPQSHGALDLWILARQALDGVLLAVPLNNYILEHFFRDTPPNSRRSEPLRCCQRFRRF